MVAHGNRQLYLTYAALMLLLIVTVGLHYAPLAPALSTWLGLGIAATKTVIVVVVFMGLARAPAADQLAAGSGLLWLAFAMTLVLADHLGHRWDEPEPPAARNAAPYTTYDRVKYAPPVQPATDTPVHGRSVSE